ncbi:MAG: ABC transporter permease [Clostridia bacterium]|nr:ABC transporter permease [Clostridia bacterium]
MNIFKKYTLRSLKKNKTRTLITIIGIILSVSMFTATVESFVTVQNLLIDYAKKNTGAYHVSFHGADSADADRITADRRVTGFTRTEDIGYAEIGSLNEAKPYLFITAVPSDFTDIGAISVTAGRLPENDREIIISEHILANGGAEIAIGDTLTLETGKRQDTDSEDVFFTQENSFRFENEKLSDTKSLTYTVTGFCNRPDHDFEPYHAPGYTAFTIKNDISGEGTLFCVLQKAADYKAFSEAYKSDEYEVKKNTNLLMFSLALHDNAFEGLFIGLGAVLIFIIVFGSVALIFNSFSISLSERTKQYGLLKSIGATKSQITKSVLFEALTLCVVAVPAGLVAGCIGIAVTFKALGGIITNLLSQFDGLEIRFVLSPAALIISALLSIFTVLLSAYIPAKRAVKISPVEAIRQNRDIKISTRNVRISPLTQKLFGLQGVLSAKNFKRNKKKYSVTVFSLFVSVVMFISASSLASYFTKAVELKADDMKYDIVMHQDFNGEFTKTETDSFIKIASSVTAANNYTVNRTVDKYIRVSKTAVSDEHIYHYPEEDKTYATCNINISFISDASFREYLKGMKLNEEEYFNTASPKALLWDNVKLIKSDNNGKQHLYSFPVFNEKELSKGIEATEIIAIPDFFLEKTFEENGITYYQFRKAVDEGEDISKSETKILTENEAVRKYTLDIGAVISEKPYFSAGMTNIIYPESMMKYTVFSEDSYNIDAYFLAENNKEAEKQLRIAVQQSGLADKISCYNYAMDIDTVRGLVTIAKVLASGFIVLISLIAAANVFNTISTNIALRAREFATLRSVGLTSKGLNIMMMYESLLYGLKSLAFSLPVSLIITVIIYFIVNESGYEIDFYIPLGTYFTAVLSVFIIVFSSMFYSIGKIRNTDIINALRTESI